MIDMFKCSIRTKNKFSSGSIIVSYLQTYVTKPGGFVYNYLEQHSERFGSSVRTGTVILPTQPPYSAVRNHSREEWLPRLRHQILNFGFDWKRTWLVMKVLTHVKEGHVVVRISGRVNGSFSNCQYVQQNNLILYIWICYIYIIFSHFFYNN